MDSIHHPSPCLTLLSARQVKAPSNLSSTHELLPRDYGSGYHVTTISNPFHPVFLKDSQVLLLLFSEVLFVNGG